METFARVNELLCLRRNGRAACAVNPRQMSDDACANAE